VASEIKMACAWRRGYAGGGEVLRLIERQAASQQPAAGAKHHWHECCLVAVLNTRRYT